MKNLNALLLSLVFSPLSAFAQAEPPSGPPWDDTCAPMEQPSFRQIFNSDSCAEEFEVAFAASSVAEMQTWMLDHKSCFHEWAHFSWLAYLRHDVKMAELAWRHQITMLETRLGESTRMLLERGLTGQIGDEARQHTSAFLNEVEKNTSFDMQMQKAKDAVTPLCLLYFDALCIGAMNRTLDLMHPRSFRLDVKPREYFTFSMIPVYRELFADAKTQKYASRLALEILDRLKADSGPKSGETLYELGLKAFAGDIDRFMKFMIVYATRGAAFATAYQMVHADNKPLFGALMVISAAMGYFDTLRMPDARPWSYLPETVSSCYQHKPYHYWMAAGFSYLMEREGTPRRTAILVARLLGAMYELGSTTMDRKPEAVFFVPPYATIVNRSRREVTHHLLGAEFGVRALRPQVQDFDEAFQKIIEGSKPLPDLSDDEMRQKISDPVTKWRYWSGLVGFYTRTGFTGPLTMP